MTLLQDGLLWPCTAAATLAIAVSLHFLFNKLQPSRTEKEDPPKDSCLDHKDSVDEPETLDCIPTEESDMVNQEDAVELCVGARVVLKDLVEASHLNGRHGVIFAKHIEGDRHGVDLDLLDPSTPRVAIRGLNLQSEGPLSNEERAGANHGILEERHGRAISMVFEAMRYMVGRVFQGDTSIQNIQDIDRIRQTGQAGILKINRLMGSGWSMWMDPGETRGTDGKGVYECLKKFLQTDLVEANGGLDNMEEEYRLIYHSIDNIKAVKGWHVRVHGDFWVVGMDNDGTLLVPDVNRSTVYKVLGVRNALHLSVPRDFQTRPIKVKITMVPWYGRLVYDGVAGTALGRPASMKLADTLERAVELAKQEGRVIDRLAQLEVPGGSLCGLDGPLVFSTRGILSVDRDGDSKEQAQQPPPTKKERRLVEKIAKTEAHPLNELANLTPQERKGMVVYRRRGYTEDDNPNHEGVVMSAVGMPVGFFCCSALEPSSEDILKSLLRLSQQSGKRPSMVGIDDSACCERLKFLFRNVEGTKICYYPPPSVEEQAAAQMGPPPPAIDLMMGMGR